MTRRLEVYAGVHKFVFTGNDAHEVYKTIDFAHSRNAMMTTPTTLEDGTTIEFKTNQIIALERVLE